MLMPTDMEKAYAILKGTIPSDSLQRVTIEMTGTEYHRLALIALDLGLTKPDGSLDIARAARSLYLKASAEYKYKLPEAINAGTIE